MTYDKVFYNMTHIILHSLEGRDSCVVLIPRFCVTFSPKFRKKLK